MTDLPQLQTNLVDAATRRRRRRRVRRVTTRVAVAATLLVAFPLLAREIAAPDPEVTAPTPTPTATTGPPKTVEEAFGAFRRPATERDTPPWLAAGDEARFIGGPKAHPVYLVKRGEELCLAVRNALEPMVCNQARAFISGDALLVRARGNLLTVALPDARQDGPHHDPGLQAVHPRGRRRAGGHVRGRVQAARVDRARRHAARGPHLLG